MSNILKGDRYKLEVNNLIDEYGDFIFRTCYLYLKDYQLAEDATQETFIKILKFKDSFNNRSSLKTWMCRIAINTCKNLTRNSWFKILKTNLTEAQPIVINDFSNNVIDKHGLIHTISSLGAKDKEVIILYYYNDLSIKEISFAIGKSENTVVQRLSRARKKLKVILSEEELYE